LCVVFQFRIENECWRLDSVFQKWRCSHSCKIIGTESWSNQPKRRGKNIKYRYVFVCLCLCELVYCIFVFVFVNHVWPTSDELWCDAVCFVVTEMTSSGNPSIRNQYMLYTFVPSGYLAQVWHKVDNSTNAFLLTCEYVALVVWWWNISLAFVASSECIQDWFSHYCVYPHFNGSKSFILRIHCWVLFHIGGLLCEVCMYPAPMCGVVCVVWLCT